MEKQRTYIAIDLKSFYASVECRMFGLGPMTTNFVVADKSRTEETSCLAIAEAIRHLRPYKDLRGGSAGEAGQCAEIYFV